MRTKLTVAIVTCATLAAAAATHAAPITVALYGFDTAADVAAFQSLSGTSKCTRKWRHTAPSTTTKGKTTTTAAPSGAMGVTLGAGTNACVLRTSVVADSSDVAPDQIVTATASLGAGGTPKLQSKAYVGVSVRASDTAGYELRVLPIRQKWQVIRDPKGAPPPAVMAAGSGKFVRTGQKPNSIAIRAFDFGTTSTNLVATVNGQSVVSTTDAATDQPDGRRNGVSVGVKGTGAGTGIVGVFDLVQIQVPNPF